MPKVLPPHLKPKTVKLFSNLDSSDLVWVGDDAELTGEEAVERQEALDRVFAELTSPKASLAKILQAIVERHPHQDDADERQARADKALALLLGTAPPRGRKPDPGKSLYAAEVAIEYWLSSIHEREPRSLQAIILEVAKRNGVVFRDDDASANFIKTVSEIFKRNKDALLTSASQARDLDFHYQRVAIEAALRSLQDLRIL